MVVFEDLALIYDQAIDWTQRLSNELPFFSSLLKNHKTARILDLACGSGRHAIALALEGFDVIGLDLSSTMIAAAEKYAQINQVAVEFITADMQKATDVVEGSFDLILCIGNSLALLPTLQAVQSTLEGAYSLLGEKGIFVAQILNFDEIQHTGFRFFPLKSGKTAKGNEVIFARFFEPITDSMNVQLVFTGFIKTETSWRAKTVSQSILQINKSKLESILQKTGFTRISFFSDYQKNPFLPLENRNLLSVASK
ncbi:MAG: class I SAM-dependent methyltransferase [Promethearchaeota archaeon]